MPELPEVESLRRHLVKRGLVSRTITGVTIARAATIQTPDVRAFEKGVTGRRIEAFDRRGKYLLLRLNGPTLIVHLRMTGKLEMVPARARPDPRTRVSFALDAGQGLRFTDWRSLGKVWLVEDPETVIGKLGPEPLGPNFTLAYVRSALARPRAVKPLLLDQAAFAGVGNLYADEILWRAKVHPLRLASELSLREAGLIYTGTRALLERATEVLERGLNEGAEFRAENGRGARRGGGDDQTHEVFQVGRGKGDRCPRCGTAIANMRVGGRGTYFCPHCQVLRRRNKVRTGLVPSPRLTREIVSA